MAKQDRRREEKRREENEMRNRQIEIGLRLLSNNNINIDNIITSTLYPTSTTTTTLISGFK